MGEAIRLLMVAALLLAATRADVRAQMPPQQSSNGSPAGGGMTLPEALRGYGDAAGNVAQQAQETIDAAKSMQFPRSNSGLVGPPTRPRTGVPTTEPSTAGNNWPSERGAPRNNRPSTEPVLPPADNASDARGGTFPMNPFSRNSASQNAASAPNGINAPRSSSDSSLRFDRATATGANVAGTLGVPQYPIPPGFGDEWTQEHIRTLCQYFGIQPDDPVILNKEAMEAYHARYKRAEQDRLIAEAAADKNSFNLFPGSQSGRFLQSAGGQRSDQGQPTAQVQPTGQVQPQGQGQGQANSSNWGMGQSWPGSQSTSDPKDWAQGNNQNNAAGPGNTALDQYGFGAGQVASNATTNPAMPVHDPALSKRDIDSLPRNGYSFDKYGNPVDRRGNLLDRRGNVIDDIDEIYRLTTGRAIEEHEAKLAQQAAQAKAMGTATSAIPGYPMNGYQANVNNAQLPRSGGVVQVAGRQSGARNDEDRMAAGSPSDQFAQSDQLSGRRPIEADQAGLSGTTKGLGKSNPLVNGLLLISILSNGFLVVWMHRLWYRHRDLIASSRKVSSGISSAD